VGRHRDDTQRAVGYCSLRGASGFFLKIWLKTKRLIHQNEKILSLHAFLRKIVFNMESIKIQAEVREGLGKRSTKTIRNNDMVPCVLYGGKEEMFFTVKPFDVRGVIYTPDFKVVDLHVGGKSHKCIVKDVQFHPVSERIMHIDFLELVPGKKVKVEIPLKFVGTSPGVKQGGKLIQQVRKVKIKTSPENFVKELDVDISGLDLGQSLRIRDITAKEGVEILNAPSIPIAIIEIPRALRSATTAAEKK
jgi:large subunit ribosomal protein L25